MTPPPSRYAPASGLAVASLVLGILGFCGPILGIAGVICGHLGLSKIAKSLGTMGGKGLAIVGLVLGYLSTLMWLIILVIGFSVGFAAFKQGEAMVKASSEPFDLSAAVVPVFPVLPEFQVLDPSRVRVAQIDLPGTGEPGSAMSLRVYLPPGGEEPKSLPCVLVAPAGTNLLSGAGLEPLDEDAYHDETLPYAEAGIVAVLYSIDGESPEESGGEEAQGEEMKVAYAAFEKAGAGTLNGRIALEFVRSRLPMVDENRIYSAGHSSAATLALLLAAHEPRLRGCLAYAPAVDIEAHFSDLIDTPFVELTLPGIRHFAKRSSPLTHAGRITAPVFLFFADDDEMIEAGSYRPFVDKLRTSNPQVTLKTVPEGGHYGAMISEGIPAGIEWIRRLEGGAGREGAGN